MPGVQGSQKGVNDCLFWAYSFVRQWSLAVPFFASNAHVMFGGKHHPQLTLDAEYVSGERRATSQNIRLAIARQCLYAALGRDDRCGLPVVWVR